MSDLSSGLDQIEARMMHQRMAHAKEDVPRLIAVIRAAQKYAEYRFPDEKDTVKCELYAAMQRAWEASNE
jgi:hypothetical protein